MRNCSTTVLQKFAPSKNRKIEQFFQTILVLALSTLLNSQKMKLSTKDIQLINFLQEKLTISKSSIAVALRRRQQDSEPLPIILWQYGLVSLEQLERIFDWQEKAELSSSSGA